MKLLQLILFFLSLVLLTGVEASANVYSQKKNNLSMDGRNRDFLPHDYPTKVTRTSKGGGGGGGMLNIQ